MTYSAVRHATSIFWKKRPLQLTFFVTRKCNAKCPFCFYLRSKDKHDNGAEELSLDEIRRISLTLGKLLWVAFSGGEIYLRKDLVEISKVFYEQNKPAVMLYPTNGLLPDVIKERTEQILRHCTNSVIVVKLSIDGVGGAHDAIRDTLGGFSKTMQSYHSLEKLIDHYPNFELGINTVFCSENQDRMDEIIEFVRTLRSIKTHTISMIRGNLLDGHCGRVNYAKYGRAIDKLEKNMKDKTSGIYSFRGARVKAAQDIVQRRLIYQTLLARKRLVPCYAGTLNLVLGESGDVYACEMLSTSFGNIRDYDYDMKKIILSRRARETADSISHYQCYCSHECYFITNILFNPRMYPALCKEYLQL